MSRWVEVPRLSAVERAALLVVANRGLHGYPAGMTARAARRAIDKLEAAEAFEALGAARKGEW